jgi:hypothetical protein
MLPKMVPDKRGLITGIIVSLWDLEGLYSHICRMIISNMAGCCGIGELSRLDG